jgi:uncharacterized protein GlcG (DUF336 family)
LIFKHLFVSIRVLLKLEVLRVQKDLNIEAREAWIVMWSIVRFVEAYEQEVVSVDEDKGNNLKRKPVAVGVFDQGGNNYQQITMDGTILISPECIAKKKAFTAVLTEEDGSVWSLGENEPNPGDPRFTPISGSAVLRAKNQVVGALAVSGRDPEKGGDEGYPQDQELANFGREMFERYLNFPEDIRKNNWMMLVNTLLQDKVL